MDPLHVLLADDDSDDCFLFKEVLNELGTNAHLTTVSNGVALMDYLLAPTVSMPDALYLDLNMPLKTGFECLAEIKQRHHLEDLPVIIFSTSMDLEAVNLLQEHGAYCYIRKPAEFINLKKVIARSLEMISRNVKPSDENFIITP